MLIDTHCHLDAAEFAADRSAVIERAGEEGVGAIVIPAVSRSNFDTVRDLAHSFRGGAYALGIHPIRSEEHTSELQSLMRISYAVFCLKKKKITKNQLKAIYHINT